jgi:hypothetical protein
MSTRSLPAHLDRVCERLTERRAGVPPPVPAFDRVLEDVTAEASAIRRLQAPIRGETRERVVARLAELDRMMLTAARAQAEPAVLEALRMEAADQLRPFRDRIAADAYDRALEAATERLLRERERLPTVMFE